jgi:hypothetical protein
VPASIPLSSIIVDNGTFQENPAAVSTSGQTVVVTVPSNIPSSQDMELDFDQSAGIVNPAASGYVSLTVATSKDAAQASNSYQIIAVPTNISQPSVLVNPVGTGVAGQYSISFDTGLEGQLVGGSDKVILTFPSNTIVPNGSMAGVQLNGTAATATGNSAGLAVTVTVPTSLAPSSAVSIYIPASAAVTNPSVATDYNLLVHTSRETTDVLSAGYAIGTNTPINTISVSNSSVTVNAFSAVTITFVQPVVNNRQESLFFNFPFNTGLPNSISTSNVLIKDSGPNPTFYNPINVSVDTSTGEIILEDPNSHHAGNTITVVIGGTTPVIQNPSQAGSYTLQASTSLEPLAATSSVYAITGVSASSHITAPAVSVAPSAASVPGNYTVNFTTGSQGRLASGTSTITLTLNSAYTLPASIPATLITVNGVAAAAVSVNTSGKQIVVTVPNTVTIGK